MTLDQFIDTYHNAPYEVEDFACAAEQVTDCEDLSTAAQQYLLAPSAFRRALDRVDVEIG